MREKRDHIYGQREQSQAFLIVFNLTLGPPDIDYLEYLLWYSIFIFLSFIAKPWIHGNNRRSWDIFVRCKEEKKVNQAQMVKKTL